VVIFLILSIQLELYAAESLEKTDELLISNIEILIKNRKSTKSAIDALKSRKSIEPISPEHYERLTRILLSSRSTNANANLVLLLSLYQKNEVITKKATTNLIKSFSNNRDRKTLAKILIVQQNKINGLVGDAFDLLKEQAKTSSAAAIVLANTQYEHPNFFNAVKTIALIIEEGKSDSTRIEAIRNSKGMLEHDKSVMINVISKVALNDKIRSVRVEAIKFINKSVDEEGLKEKVFKGFAKDVMRLKAYSNESMKEIIELQIIWANNTYPDYLIDSWVSMSVAHTAKYTIPVLEEIVEGQGLSEYQLEAILEKARNQYFAKYRKRLYGIAFKNKNLIIGEILNGLESEDYYVRLHSSYLIDLYNDKQVLSSKNINRVYNLLLSDKQLGESGGVLANLLVKYGRLHNNQEQELIEIFKKHNRYGKAFFDLVIHNSNIESVVLKYGSNESIPGELRSFIVSRLFSKQYKQDFLSENIRMFLTEIIKRDSEKVVRMSAVNILEKYNHSLPLRSYLDKFTSPNFTRKLSIEDIPTFYLISILIYFVIREFISLSLIRIKTKKIAVTGVFSFLFALTIVPDHGMIWPFPANIVLHEGIFQGDFEKTLRALVPLISIWLLLYKLADKKSNTPSFFNYQRKQKKVNRRGQSD